MGKLKNMHGMSRTPCDDSAVQINHRGSILGWGYLVQNIWPSPDCLPDSDFEDHFDKLCGKTKFNLKLLSVGKVVYLSIKSVHLCVLLVGFHSGMITYYPKQDRRINASP